MKGNFFKNVCSDLAAFRYIRFYFFPEFIRYCPGLRSLCFLADMDDFAAFNEVYAKYFVSKPARSCVAVKVLPKRFYP